MKPLRKAINGVQRQYPQLCKNGFCESNGALANPERRRELRWDDFEQQVQDTITYVAACGLGGWSDNYGLKHKAERFCGRYVSPGAAIVAMLILGHEPCIDASGRGPNCTFKHQHRRRDRSVHRAYRGERYRGGLC